MSIPALTLHRSSPLRDFSSQVVVSLIAAAAVFALMLVGFAAPAHASTGSFDEFGPGYSDVISGEDAGSYYFNVEGSRIEAYCLQMNAPFNPAASFTTASASASGISNVGTAAWIGINHASVGTPLADANAEKAATQVAIWAYTDGATIDDSTVASPSIRDRANELVAAAAGQSRAATPGSYDLDVTLAVSDDLVTATAYVTTGSTTPVEGVEVTFEFSDGSTVSATTNSGGAASVDGPAASDGDTIGVTASADVTVAAGAALMPGDGSQILISVNSFTSGLEASDEVLVTVETQAPPTTSTTPTSASQPPVTTVPPVSTTVPQVTSLAATGGPSMILVFAAGLVLAAGAAFAYRKARTER